MVLRWWYDVLGEARFEWTLTASVGGGPWSHGGCLLACFYSYLRMVIAITEYCHQDWAEGPWRLGAC